MIALIPSPKKFSEGSESFPLYEIENIIMPEEYSTTFLDAVVTLADEMEKTTSKRIRFAHSDMEGKSIVAGFDSSIEDPEGYRLSASENGIIIEASAEVGLFYAVQTLRQIVKSCGNFYPSLAIEDAPDFENRGFYHDVTRGKVPTLETMFALADKMAYYKLNQLQLYIEHTFAFARHCDVWAGSDPLTAEEIIRLDHYCNERHIDLVPSLSTFGHFYMALRSKRKEDLNELDVKGSEKPFSFSARMAHYTLNCSDERSIELIEDMLDEFLPLFSSPYFNICCDETFDLGKGKNAARAEADGSADNMYVEFLEKIINAVSSRGRIAMFWGDIIGDKPELLAKLPEGTVPLEWDYGFDAAWHDTKKLAEVAKEFYICPGCCGWNRWINNIHHAQNNIWKYAKKGIDAGASGVLNTDWGDHGHINLLANSYHGMAFGAAASWNVADAKDFEKFDDAFDVLELGCKGFTALWKKFVIDEFFTWGVVQLWVDPAGDGSVNEVIAKTPVDEIKSQIVKLENDYREIMRLAPSAHCADPLTMDEIIFGCEMSLVMHKICLAMVAPEDAEPFAVADKLRILENRFSILWHKRNKPSEYYRIREILLIIADKLDTISKELQK